MIVENAAAQQQPRRDDMVDIEIKDVRPKTQEVNYQCACFLATKRWAQQVNDIHPYHFTFNDTTKLKKLGVFRGRDRNENGAVRLMKAV